MKYWIFDASCIKYKEYNISQGQPIQILYCHTKGVFYTQLYTMKADVFIKSISTLGISTDGEGECCWFKHYFTKTKAPYLQLCIEVFHRSYSTLSVWPESNYFQYSQINKYRDCIVDCKSIGTSSDWKTMNQPLSGCLTGWLFTCRRSSGQWVVRLFC